MSRPIPEGVENCPSCKAVLANGWNRCGMCGWRKESLLCKFVRTHNDGTTPSVPEADTDQEFADRILKTLTDKDALIRDLVGALIGYRKAFNDGPENCSYADYDHADTVAEAALTSARTTCQEAFNGCSENSSY